MFPPVDGQIIRLAKLLTAKVKPPLDETLSEDFLNLPTITSDLTAWMRS